MDIYSPDQYSGPCLLGLHTPRVYCRDHCIKQGPQKFEDNVLQERQLPKVVYGEQMLLDKLTLFNEKVVKNGA